MPKKTICIKINGKKIEAEEGEMVLTVAQENGFEIPNFCYYKALTKGGSCMACLVEVQDSKRGNWVTTSCNLRVKEGMEIKLDTIKVKKLRKQNMEMLFAGHLHQCDLNSSYACRLEEIFKKYDIDTEKYHRDDDKLDPFLRFNNAIEVDTSICIGCTRCTKACESIGIGYIVRDENSHKNIVTNNKDPKVDCIYCGQCTATCPVGAAREQGSLEEVMKVLGDKDKIVIAQTAPSVRTSLGEEFKMPLGTNVEGKLNTAYRMLGFNKVFDVSFGADVTTLVEAEELVERLEEESSFGIGHHLPMFTSCCPSWVKFVEFYYPELIPNLTTARSPHIHSGVAYKTWWAEKMGVDPKKIIIVSIMPCTSKKYEASMEKFNVDGLKPVDYSINAREIATLIRRKGIDFANLEDSKVDQCGEYGGAGVIYGSSGGVMESALRTAHKMITGKEIKNLDLKSVRTGLNGYKTAEIKIGNEEVRVAVVSTPEQAKKIIEEIKVDPKKYHYVEVMACRGGCIGGGGQPFVRKPEIIDERRKVLYDIDKHKKIRLAHKNPIATEFFDWAEKQGKEKRNSLLFTDYNRKIKGE